MHHPTDRSSLIVLAFCALLSTAACAGQKHQSPPVEVPTASPPAEKRAAPTAGAADDEAPSRRASPRKIVETATLTVEASDARETVERIDALAESHGGYVVRSNDDAITIRVVSNRLDDAIGAITDLTSVDALVEKNLYSRDVTDRVTDYEIRLDNKLEARRRYLELIDRASDVEGMLKVEKQLERLNGEIERLKGHLKGLRHRSALSEISVEIRGGSDRPWGDSGRSVTPMSPTLSYTALSLDAPKAHGLLQGATIELALLSWRDLAAQNGPSHGRLFVNVSLLRPEKGAGELWGIWSGGMQMSFESAPKRRWLIPIFGFEAGQILSPSEKAAHLTPSAGLHVWSGANFDATIEGSYTIPPGALETLRGWRADVGLGFSFW